MASNAAHWNAVEIKKKDMENVEVSGTVMNAGSCQLSASKRMQI